MHTPLPSVCLPGFSLASLVEHLSGPCGLHGDGAVRVTGVRHDSREVEPGDLFVVRRGGTADGAQYVGEALERGAVALVREKSENAFPLPPGIPCVDVEDARLALGSLASALYRERTQGLRVVGVTGTNGKTTTTHLLASALRACMWGEFTGTVGTLGASFRRFHTPLSHTTPEADTLVRLLAGMRQEGALVAAMEVSSIALTQHRVVGISFDVAAFTNLTQDHLDLHGSMEAYAEAKEKLFVDCRPRAAVLCVDHPWGRGFAARTAASVMRVSAQWDGGVEADIAPRSVRSSPRGLTACVRTPQGDLALESPLVGLHNLENLVVTLGVVHALGLDLRQAVEGLRAAQGAPGRLEPCHTEQDDIAVFVDYAHTPDALAAVLQSVRVGLTGRLWLVFGCGGDRDPSKRSVMGEVAGAGADLVVITSDNPRSEDPARIAAAIAGGIQSQGMPFLSGEELACATRGCLLELDRRKAIATAILSAQPGDLVLLAGKGHEAYQIVRAVQSPFCDREEALQVLEKRRGGGKPTSFTLGLGAPSVRSGG